MNTTLINIIGCIFRYFYVILTIRKEEKNKNNVYKEILYCVLYIAGYRILKSDNWRMYIFQCSYTIFIIWLELKNRKSRNDLDISRICILLSIYEIGSIISDFFGIFLIWFIGSEIKSVVWSLTISLIIKTIYFINLLYWTPKMGILKVVTKRDSYIIYLLIVTLKIPFLYTEIRDALALKMVVLTILCCTVIFLIISGIDKYNAQKERERIEENNKKLSSRLHKSQEILPAMVQVLSHVTENGGTEMETQKAQELLAEVNDLYGRQLRENSEEDLQLKNFCSTGLKMLDQQLKVYQMEAIDRNVNLDIFVQAPINDLIKKDGIDQWRLQRAVGDLVRNAFRAVEKEDKKCRANKHILLIIGCRYEGILEVAVVDNGTEFPLHVIEAFGKRGVTTGGTGNGLADLVEFADDMGASISVDEFDGRTSLFTKRVSISFDKQRKNNFNSVRKEFVGGSFWNIW